MIYPLVSTNSDCYNTIETDITLTFNSDRINYYVETISTCCNFLITTSNDYILINQTYIYFEDRCEYEPDSLVGDLNKLFDTNKLSIKASMGKDNVISFKGALVFNINEASHRVKMLLGMIDMSFPINCDSYKMIVLKTAPITNFGNVLYLKSIHGKEVITNSSDNGVESKHHPLILFRINTFLKSGLPLIIKNNHKRDSINVNYDAISHIKLELVDYKLEPVILKSPLFITLAIEPCISNNNIL